MNVLKHMETLFLVAALAVVGTTYASAESYKAQVRADSLDVSVMRASWHAVLHPCREVVHPSVTCALVSDSPPRKARFPGAGTVLFVADYPGG